MKIRKGDRVQVLAGKDKGKTGNVTFAYPATDKVVVDGLNVAKKHQKPKNTPKNPTYQGGIIDKEMPMPASNVALICGSCSKPTRIGYRFEPNGTKVRVCRKCGEDLS